LPDVPGQENGGGGAGQASEPAGAEGEEDDDPLAQSDATPDGGGIADHQGEDVPVCKHRAKVEQRLGLFLASGIPARQCRRGDQNTQTAMIENGFVYIPEAAPWLAEYLHELTVFPKGKHDDQVDSTAQFLDWFKKPYPGQGIFEYYRMRAERLQNPENPQRYRVRLLAPPGIGSVYTFSRRTINVGPNGTIEMSADDAQYLIRAGWTKLAEWTRDEAA
jgi:hypothetical protein